jgi:hypothetical protein
MTCYFKVLFSHFYFEIITGSFFICKEVCNIEEKKGKIKYIPGIKSDPQRENWDSRSGIDKRSKSSGMLCHVNWYTVTDISEESSASIFRVKQSKNGTRIGWHNIPED